METNALSIDGVSTAYFSFDVYVEVTDGFNYAKKKNQLIESDYTSGAIKNDVKAWSPIVKTYQLYCPFATLKDMREIKKWAKDSGQLIDPDEPDVYYEILDVDMEKAKLDPVSGYKVNVSFVTAPFAYELQQVKRVYRHNDMMINETNAPMYPRISVRGQSNQEVAISIGNQTLYLKHLHNEVTIESKPLKQNVFNEHGAVTNSLLRGDFFEVLPGENRISLQGADSIEVLERWAWL